MSQVTPSQFLQHFPAFDLPDQYDVTMIQWNIDAAEGLLKQDVWGDLWERGVELFTAHMMYVGFGKPNPNGGGSSSGGTSTNGVVASKSVAGVSVSYDTKATTLEGDSAAFYNQSPYGIQFLTWARMVGFSQSVMQL